MTCIMERVIPQVELCGSIGNSSARAESDFCGAVDIRRLGYCSVMKENDGKREDCATIQTE